MSSASSSSTRIDADALLARVAALEASHQAREERIELLEEENRWLKAQLFGRSSEKTPIEERHPNQAHLFNEAEALAQAAEQAPVSITIPAHERGKGGRKKLSAALPRVEVVHDLPEDQKRCIIDGTALKRMGEEVSTSGADASRSTASEVYWIVVAVQRSVRGALHHLLRRSC